MQQRRSIRKALHQCLIVEPNRKQAGGTVTGCGSITVVVRVMAALLVTGGLGTVRLSDWHSVAQKQNFSLVLTFKISSKAGEKNNHGLFFFDTRVLTCHVLTSEL